MQVRLTFFYPPHYLFGGGKTGITITGVPFVTIGLPSRSVIWFLIDTPAPRLSDESISSISCSSFPGYTVLSMTAGGYSSRSLFGSVCTFAIRLLLRLYAPGQSITPPGPIPSSIASCACSAASGYFSPLTTIILIVSLGVVVLCRFGIVAGNTVPAGRVTLIGGFFGSAGKKPGTVPAR